MSRSCACSSNVIWREIHAPVDGSQASAGHTGRVRFRKSAAAVLTSAALVATGTAPAHAAIEPQAYGTSGKQVTLATDKTGGPELKAGLYQAELPNDGSPRSFTINRNQMRTFLASVLTDEREGKALKATGEHKTKVSILDAKGDDCTSDTGTLSKDAALTFLNVNVGVDDDEDVSRGNYLRGTCRESTKLSISIEHNGIPANGRTKAEVLLTNEPKGTGSVGSPATVAQTATLKAPDGKVRGEVAPGKGFGDAATLVAGTHSLKLGVGTQAFYKVRLDWGQRLAVTLRVPGKDTNFASPIAVEVSTRIWTPQRIALDANPKDYQYSDSLSMSANSSKGATIGTYTAPVLWANRYAKSESGNEVPQASLQWTTTPGWYYVTVWTRPASFSSSDEPMPDSVPPIPADLNIAVVGDVQQGPTFVNTGGAKLAQPGKGEMSIGQGVQTGAPFPWAKVALSALAVLAAAAAVLWALRSRRQA